MDLIETWQFPNERLRNRLCRGTPLVTIESRYRVGGHKAVLYRRDTASYLIVTLLFRS